jgi:amino acid adenylation domain-containing protein
LDGAVVGDRSREPLSVETHPGDLMLGNVAEILWSNGQPQQQIAVIERREAVSYGALRNRAGVIASSLLRSGVEAGERVAVLLPRGAEAAACFFGVLAAGAVAVIVNESLRPRQVEHIVRHSDSTMIITSDEVLGQFDRRLDVAGSIVESSALQNGPPTGPVPRTLSDIAQIIYTSGSTGVPKGVTVSHGNVWSGITAVVRYLGISSVDRIASLLPFSFDYGLNQLLCSAAVGATLVVERSPVPQRIVRSLRESAVTVLPALPPLWLQLLGAMSFRENPITSLRVMTNTGGSLTTATVRQIRRSQPGADLVLMYGLTEAFRSTFLDPARVDEKPRSIGRAIPGAEIMVLREDLTACHPGEVGQLVHRGPTVALGYWADREATERVFRPNPLRPHGAPDAERVVFSGDLVSRDEDGDLTFVGREDALIKVLGYRVSPDEVVEALQSSGEVLEAVVTSEPDELMGARVVAHVVLKDAGRIAELEEYCQRELPRYMRPARFDVRAELPRTHSGKFDLVAVARETDAVS